MNRDLMIDAISLIDVKYLEQYDRYESFLLRKRKKSYRTVLVSAACFALVFTLLLVALPVGYYRNREAIDGYVAESIDQILFPLDQTDDPATQEKLQLNWVQWPLTESVFIALGAGTQDSVIDKMQADTDGLFGNMNQSLGDLLGRMYQYYLDHKQEIDAIIGEGSTESESDDESETEIESQIETESVDHTVAYTEGQIVTVEQPGLVLRYENGTFAVVGTTDDYQESELEIPEDYNSVAVTSIDANAFAKQSALRSVTIPDSVTAIGAFAFADCSALESIVLPLNLSEIPESMCQGCSSLKKIDLDGITVIGKKAFYGCSAMRNLTIAQSVISIGDEAFASCTGMTSVKFTNNIEDMGSDIFNGCTELLKADLGALVHIAESMFDGCNSLNDVKVCENMTEIGATAFRKCSNLDEIEGLTVITKIGASAFRESGIDCDIVFGQPIEVLPSHVFYGCEWLTSVTIPTSVKSIESNALIPGTLLWKVDYEGTVEEWLEIDVAPGAIRKGIAIYCTDGMVLTENNSIQMYE
ncbi:MAG: leucine-rich repeat protein [Clostridia bacterium]|nr:leucine-rich repeat protein [Clostridia bacterium]